MSARLSQHVGVRWRRLATARAGRVYDAAAAGQLAERHGVPYVLDACQSVGQLPLDVSELRCDFLTGTGRKYLRAPRGCGFLYASRDALGGAGKFRGAAAPEPARLDNAGARWDAGGGYSVLGSARRYEQYEMSFAAKVREGSTGSTR